MKKVIPLLLLPLMFAACGGQNESAEEAGSGMAADSTQAMQGSGMMQDSSGMMQDSSGMMQDSSGMMQDTSGMAADTSGMGGH